VGKIRRPRLGIIGRPLTEQLDAALSEAVKDSASPHAVLDSLLEAEISAREARRVKTALRLSSLPTGQTLAEFDFAFQPGVERSKIELLGTCGWVKATETLLIQGPPDHAT
jgi:DNA replication protein DnaC